MAELEYTTNNADSAQYGSISALNAAITFIFSGASEGIDVSGTWNGTLVFEGTINGTTWFSIKGLNLSTYTQVSSITSNGNFIVPCAEYFATRVRFSIYTSGSATIFIFGSNSSQQVLSTQPTNSLLNSINTIKGDTDGTLIGNVRDRLKVDANITEISGGAVPAFSSKIRADILQIPVTISSLVTYTNIYTYSGTGLLTGFSIEFNGVNVVIKFQVDGNIIFDGVDLSTLNSFLVTADAQYRRQAGTGIVTASSSLDWSMKYPVAFASNVTISARLSGGTSKNFQQGIIYIVKAT